MTESAIDMAFNTFATTEHAAQRKQALSDLMALKAIPKQAEDPRFAQGFQRLCALASDPNIPAEDRLLGIAEMMRIGQTVRKWQDRIATALKPAFTSPLPQPACLKDGDDRLNLARACALFDAEWMPSYLARSIAEEEQGEKARAEMMATLFARASSVSEILTLLAAAFAEVRPMTEAPADSMGRRLVRTLATVRSALLGSLIDAGNDVGAAFNAMIRSALRKSGRPQDEKVQLDLTKETALTLHDLVRTHFSVATEPETFSALGYCRAFFRSISWPEEVRPVLEYLVQDVSEAILLLGRQDVPNQKLLEQLELVCGVKERARAVAAELADRHAELPERIREWLRQGRLVQTIATSDVLEESLLSATDAAIGLALIEARLLKQHAGVGAQISSSLEIFDPPLASRAGSFIAQVLTTCQSIEEIAKRRSLALHGSTGEETEYAPKYFDLVSPVSGRTVVVRRPAVVRTNPQGNATDVVLKGMVE